MKILDAGAASVWPKILKCSNCGNEVEVASMADLAGAMPGFGWIVHTPFGFQFACPNYCGAAYVAIDPVARQAFHHAPSVMYGGADLTSVRVGGRRPATTRRRRRQRPAGGAHGPVSSA